MKRGKLNHTEILFIFLLLFVLLLSSLALAKSRGFLISDLTSRDTVDGNTVYLDRMNLEQKIAQMVVVHGSFANMEVFKQMQLGGIHEFAVDRVETFDRVVQGYQEDMVIPFFVTVDLEGCLNPFAAFANFTYASEITSLDLAYAKGAREGRYLRERGVSINYAPVVDLDDEIWRCRAFPGENATRVSGLAGAYLRGLQSQGVIGTIKHYPGKTLVVRDPHKHIVSARIDEQDVYPYFSLGDEAQAAMVSHLIVSGELDSGGVPSVVSEDAITELRSKFQGLVISDEVNMLGLKDFYPTLDEMYIAVFSAGNDLVLNFNDDPNEIYRMIVVIREAVEDGRILEENIDASVTKILEAKGFVVAQSR